MFYLKTSSICISGCPETKLAAENFLLFRSTLTFIKSNQCVQTNKQGTLSLCLGHLAVYHVTEVKVKGELDVLRSEYLPIYLATQHMPCQLSPQYLALTTVGVTIIDICVRPLYPRLLMCRTQTFKLSSYKSTGRSPIYKKILKKTRHD